MSLGPLYSTILLKKFEVVTFKLNVAKYILLKANYVVVSGGV